MIYKNFEIHNVAEIFENADGSISWRRLPETAVNSLEKDVGKGMAHNCTGVELRFVIKGKSATIRMSAVDNGRKMSNCFHVYRGGLQGGYADHEIDKFVPDCVRDFVIERSDNMDNLKYVTEKTGLDWDCEVVRVIFDRGTFKIYDIIGDIEPPKKGQTPKKTLLAYGSSITHGSNSIDASHGWVSILAHNLNMDARNLGMAGSCAMEPPVVEYIASMGEKGEWDVATLELGVNVINWDDEKIYTRVENTLRQIAGRNPQKPVFVISPFYRWKEHFDRDDNAPNWRCIIEKVIKKLDYPNVTYINGLDVIDDISYISGDEVHPNIYGVQRIADIVTEKIKRNIGEF